MRRIVLTAFGGPESLEITDEVTPEPGPGEIRVRVLAASVQYTDVIIRKGVYADLKERPPFTPGYDVVGEVEAVGPGVDRGWLGARVADLTTIGSQATHRLLRANEVSRVPDGVDAAEAAATVLSWTTAYQLLHRHAKVSAGQTVLIHGAAGAVGRPLLRLGQLAGLRMYGTARAEHADLVASFGAIPIDYQNERFEGVLTEGADVVFDGIGEGGFRRSFSVVKRGGMLSAFGLSAAVNADASLLRTGLWFTRPFFWNLLPNGKRAGFYSITKMREQHPRWFEEDLAALMGMLAEGTIKPKVAQRIAFEDVADAHRRLEAGGLTGKLVLTPRAAPLERAPAPTSRSSRSKVAAAGATNLHP